MLQLVTAAFILASAGAQAADRSAPERATQALKFHLDVGSKNSMDEMDLSCTCCIQLGDKAMGAF